MGILLNDPMGPTWREGQLDEKLRTRLGSSYLFYKSIIGRMNDALNDLQALLGIKQGQVCQMTLLITRLEPHLLCILFRS